MKKKFITILSISLLVLTSCSSVEKKLIPTYNKGGYSINILEKKLNADLTDVYISGHVFDVANGKPISNVQLTLGCLKYETSSNGEYSFRIKHADNSTLYIKVVSIGYKTVETDVINFYKNNKIKVDFYLAEDDRPFINCEGKN